MPSEKPLTFSEILQQTRLEKLSKTELQSELLALKTMEDSLKSMISENTESQWSENTIQRIERIRDRIRAMERELERRN